MALAMWRSSAPMPGKAPGGVDDGDHGQAELAGEFHQAQRLAVTLGVGAAEVAHDVLLGVAPLLGAHDHDPCVAQLGEAGDHRLVVGVKPVAVQFGEIVKGAVEVIERVGTPGVAGELHALPGGEVRVNALSGFLDLGPDLVGFTLEVHLDPAWQRGLSQGIQLGLKVDKRLLKIEVGFHSGFAGGRSGGILMGCRRGATRNRKG